MRGLLIKDIKLMKNNGKSLFLILIFVGATMGIVMKNVYMSVGYAFFIFTMFTVSTISYDEYDNGYPFLFTLPITRRQSLNKSSCLKKPVFMRVSAISISLLITN